MKKLSFNALLLMDEQKVIVHDLEYDSYDQECIVKVSEKPSVEKARRSTKVRVVASNISLINEEFIFEYNCNGKCLNGDFEVYSL